MKKIISKFSSAAPTAAELAIGGKRGEGMTTGGGEEALKYGSSLLLLLTLMATVEELKAAGNRVEDSCRRCRTATRLLLPGGEGGRECSHQGAGNIK
jgi:hypothetical protein